MTQHYQDNLGGWHVLDSVEHEHLLTKNNPGKTFTLKTQTEYDAAHAPQPPTAQEQRDAISNAIQKLLDDKAKSLRYDSHRDLGATTSISDLLDLGWACDGVVAQCSFAVPLAECFDKPLLGIWAANGLHSHVAYIRTITPRKILTKTTSHYVVDDWPTAKITEVARAFYRLG